MFCVIVNSGPLDNVKMLTRHEIDVIAAKVNIAETPSDVGKLNCRILLAEDGPDNQRLLTFILKKAGAEVIPAENGKVAIDKVHATELAGEFFDVILMDIQMPELDGYGATRQLRQEGYTRPIIALTAHAMNEDRQKCLDAGCDEFATKPIDRHDLIAVIQSQIASVETSDTRTG